MPIKKTVTGGKVKEAFETDKKGKITTAIKIDNEDKKEEKPRMEFGITVGTPSKRVN